jgi:hypothetical protein
MKKRCNQCWQRKPRADFVGPSGRERKQNCNACTARRPQDELERRNGTRRRRTGLNVHTWSRVIWMRQSNNRKLGGIPASIVAPGSCPRSCPFWGRGCFAEFGLLGHHWAQAVHGRTWSEYCDAVSDLPRGQLWRHAVAGDLPGKGEALDPERLWRLVHACRRGGTQGFTYTHKPLRDSLERAAVQYVNSGHGLTINLSANSLEHADHLAALRIGPVVAVVPTDYPARGSTPGGRVVRVCPYELRGELTCARCRMCGDWRRRDIIALRAHGQSKRIVSDIVRAA